MNPAACPVCASLAVEYFCSAFDRILQRPEEPWRILRCRSCGCGWTCPPLAESDIPTYYPKSYLGDTSRIIDDFQTGRLQRSRSWRKETEKVGLVSAYQTRGVLLDVGCAEGKFLWALRAQDWDRWGVEPAGEVVALVASRLPDLRIVHGDIFSPALPDEHFDVVTFWHVFEHLARPRDVLRRVTGLLRRGGWVFISLPNFAAWQVTLFRQHWYAFDDVPRHLYHFSPRALEILLAEAGLAWHRQLFFSRIVNTHCLKYSAINWSEERFGSRWPYYVLKPALLAFPWLEALSRRYGMMTVIARKPR